MSYWRVIGAATGYHGRDAEEDITYRRSNEGVTGDKAKKVIDRIKEIAEGPKKKEDRDVQEHVCPVHEPLHLELAKASK